MPRRPAARWRAGPAGRRRWPGAPRAVRRLSRFGRAHGVGPPSGDRTEMVSRGRFPSTTSSSAGWGCTWPGNQPARRAASRVAVVGLWPSRCQPAMRAPATPGTALTADRICEARSASPGLAADNRPTAAATAPADGRRGVELERQRHRDQVGRQHPGRAGVSRCGTEGRPDRGEHVGGGAPASTATVTTTARRRPQRTRSADAAVTPGWAAAASRKSDRVTVVAESRAPRPSPGRRRRLPGGSTPGIGLKTPVTSCGRVSGWMSWPALDLPGRAAALEVLGDDVVLAGREQGAVDAVAEVHRGGAVGLRADAVAPVARLGGQQAGHLRPQLAVDEHPQMSGRPRPAPPPAPAGRAATGVGTSKLWWGALGSPLPRTRRTGRPCTAATTLRLTATVAPSYTPVRGGAQGQIGAGRRGGRGRAGRGRRPRPSRPGSERRGRPAAAPRSPSSPAGSRGHRCARPARSGPARRRAPGPSGRRPPGCSQADSVTDDGPGAGGHHVQGRAGGGDPARPGRPGPDDGRGGVDGAAGGDQGVGHDLGQAALVERGDVRPVQGHPRARAGGGAAPQRRPAPRA